VYPERRLACTLRGTAWTVLGPRCCMGSQKHKVFRFTVSVTITVNEMNFFWVSGSIPRWDYAAFVFGCSPLCPR
jgi:hypothetical protein